MLVASLSDAVIYLHAFITVHDIRIKKIRLEREERQQGESAASLRVSVYFLMPDVWTLTCCATMIHVSNLLDICSLRIVIFSQGLTVFSLQEVSGKIKLWNEAGWTVYKHDSQQILEDRWRLKLGSSCTVQEGGDGGPANVVVRGRIVDQKASLEISFSHIFILGGKVAQNLFWNVRQVLQDSRRCKRQIYTFKPNVFRYSIINQRIKTEMDLPRLQPVPELCTISCCTLLRPVISRVSLSVETLVDQESGVPIGFMWKD